MKVKKPMSDQSALWGATLEFWDRRGVLLMIVGGVLGFVALGATVASSFILWKVAGLAQSDLEKVTRLHETEIADSKREFDKYKQDSNERISATDARAAEANKKAEEERRERLRLEASISPRRLKLEQIKSISDGLAKYAGQKVRLQSYALDVESAVLGEQLLRALKGAHIEVDDHRMSQGTFGSIATGVRVTGTETAFVNSLLLAFSHLGGLAVSAEAPPPLTGLSISDDDSPVAASVFVGVKPIAPMQ